MNNQDIRIYAFSHNVKLWQIAEKMGLYESNFSRLLRHELPTDRKKEIKKIIDGLAKERQSKLE